VHWHDGDTLIPTRSYEFRRYYEHTFRAVEEPLQRLIRLMLFTSCGQAKPFLEAAQQEWTGKPALYLVPRLLKQTKTARELIRLKVQVRNEREVVAKGQNFWVERGAWDDGDAFQTLDLVLWLLWEFGHSQIENKHILVAVTSAFDQIRIFFRLG
jgi:hypothetical protein